MLSTSNGSSSMGGLLVYGGGSGGQNGTLSSNGSGSSGKDLLSVSSIGAGMVERGAGVSSCMLTSNSVDSGISGKFTLILQNKRQKKFS